MNMPVTEQYGVKNILDQVLQLIYMSTKLFSSFELDCELGYVRLSEEALYPPSERQKLLTYFLDLIEFLAHERMYLVQDPTDELCYALTGCIGGI